ncbi:MAG TPA: protein kinase [Kofleriaceae bacterium]
MVALLGVQRIGRYEVLSHLASGGMGQVYLARSTGLGGFEREVVVKTLDLSITDDDDAFVTMFLDEARLVGALHHQYIAPVYEVGCDEEGRYYLVMDYVNGETAEAVYRATSDRCRQLPLNFALTVVSCVASALDYAHNLCAADGTPLDIVHRDISLSNVMIGYDGAVKLIDFGIAKAANRATKTQVGTLKGKIGYLAPEQILRKDVDHRADIFALGIVLYELTTQTRAFRESSDLVTLERITNGEIKPPSSFVPDYPRELERIVLKALQVDPELRYQDVAAMGRELEAFAARLSMPLGHAAVIGVMKSLFGEHRHSRRRIARGSNEVSTDPSLHALDEDEKTPILDLLPGYDAAEEDSDVRTGSRVRALRPTTPMPASEAALGELPVRPTPPTQIKPFKSPIPPGMDMQMQERPTPPERPPSPQTLSPQRAPFGERKTLPLPAKGTPPPPRSPQHTPTGPQLAVDVAPRVPTGPQLPVVIFRDSAPHVAPPHDIADAPTHITGMRPDHDEPGIASTRPEREDPTDVSGAIMMPLPPPGVPRRSGTGTAEIAKPHWVSSTMTDAIVSRVKPAFSAAARTWLLLCALFAMAVATAIVIALL